jgi:hypothetical protein
MSSDSLISNIEYNVNMDRNISLLSNQSTIPPEDLSYAINIVDAEIYVPNAEVYISDIKEKHNSKCELLNNNKILIINIAIRLLAFTLIILIIIWIISVGRK